MAVGKLQELLDSQHIRYDCINHSPSFTAQETAQSAHLPGKILAKTVIVKMDGKLAMIVLTANDKINFNHLLQSLGQKKVELATERDFKDKFPECEIGAMPPFGNLFGMDVYVDENLTKDSEIVFNSGTHSELIRMSYLDFEKMVHPKVVDAS